MATEDLVQADHEVALTFVPLWVQAHQPVLHAGCALQVAVPLPTTSCPFMLAAPVAWSWALWLFLRLWSQLRLPLAFICAPTGMGTAPVMWAESTCSFLRGPWHWPSQGEV